MIPELPERREPQRNLVDGRIENFEPSSGRPFPPLDVTPIEEIPRIVERARAAQVRWAAQSWSARRRVFHRVRDLCGAHVDKLVELLVRETGKPQIEALTMEVFPLAEMANYFGRAAKRILRDEKLPWRVPLLGGFGLLKRGTNRYVPRGVVGVISPWNFPLTIPVGDVIMALAARNAVVVKPSEWTPRILLRMKELFVEAGLDPELFGVVIGGGEQGAALVEAVDMMIFTGSVQTGRKVGETCGRRLIPYVAELGGKDAAIVFEDADLELAAQQVVYGAFVVSGQACASIERLLVQETIHDRFVERVIEKTKALRQGDPLGDAGTDLELGAMVVPAQLETVRRHVEDAKTRGAKVHTGGETLAGPGRFFSPTVLTDVPTDAAIWTDETFGPCLPIRKFRTEDEAIAESNRTAFGLSTYLFTRDARRARAVARRLESGTVVVNDAVYTHAHPEAPWGGVKQSGVGRVHGDQGLRDLCEVQHLAEPKLSIVGPWSHPFSAGKYRFFRFLLRTIFRLPFA